MSSALDRINEYNKKKKEQYTTAVNKTNEVYGGVSALDRIDNYSKTHNLTLNDNNKATPNAVASVSEYSNLSKEQLLTKRKDLLNQLNNYEREEKVKWWDEDNNIFENVGNVLYKTFVEDQKTKYKDDTELEKLKKQYEDISKEIENRTIQEESQNLSTLDKIGYTITGNLSTSLKGIESTAQKILGQTPENADLTYEERMAQVSREQTSGLGGVALDVLGSASRMLPQMAIGNPIGATTMGFANYGGSAYNEAKRSGADETRATLYGIAVGGLETALNKILPSFNYGGENIFGKTLSDKLTSKIMNKVLGNGVLKRVIADGAGEFTEEYLQQFLEPIIKESILEENHDVGINDAKTIGEIAKNLAVYTKDNFFSTENAYAGMLGFISSASLGLPSNIMQSRINQANVQNSIKNNETPNINIPNTENSQQNNLNSIKYSELENDLNNMKKDSNFSNNSMLSFSEQVDNVINGTFPQRDMLVVSENTPKVLQDIGLNDLPITMTQKHLNTIMNSSGQYKDANYHDLGIDIVKQLPRAIAEPLNVLKSNTKDDSIVVITDLADNQERPVIASIKIDGRGQINDVQIDSNVMTSAYGRNNYDKFMKENIARGNLLYDIDEGITKKSDATDRVQFPMRSSSNVVASDIPKNTSPISDNNVTTNQTKSQTEPLSSQYSMQQNVKNDTLRGDILPKAKRDIPQDPTKESTYNTKEEIQELTTKQQRHKKIQEYRQQAKEDIGDMSGWQDTSLMKQKTNTMKRNLRDIMSKEQADILYKKYFQNISKNNATIENEINKYNSKIQDLNLSDKESTAVQMLGEYKYNPDTIITGLQVNDYISNNKLNYDKISKSVEVFRKTYDELFTKANETLKEQGYDEIPYRKGYFPHFIEEHGKTILGRFAEKLGWKFNKQELPTDIAGLTENFLPGKKWTSFTQHRKGKITDYNALKGFDNYVRGAMDVIYHTEDIQKLRALENEIRYQHSEKGVQEQIDKISENDMLTAEQQEKLMEEVYDNYKIPLPNFVTNLRDFTNNLAGKKSSLDRSMEQGIGRDMYNTMSNISNRVSANMVGLNISSALTNFIPITQAWSQVKTKNLVKAVKQTMSSTFADDHFADSSTFLTNRTKKADRLYKTGLEKASDKAGVLFEAIDSFTSNVIVRSKYLENIENGMSKSRAIENADEFAKDVIAGRSKGELPTIFNSKNPVVKLVTAFQLEVNNQYGYMFKDLPKDLKDEGMAKLVGAFLKMFLGAWLYNKAKESITGTKSAFSPIDMIEETIETVGNEDLSTYEKISTTAKNYAQELPFVGGLLGGGRLPINSAIPDVATVVESVTNLSSEDTDKKQAALKNLANELKKPLFYVVMPFGGGQLKKTTEGASMYSGKLPTAGSYTASGNLRFTADESAGGKAKALLFGQYSSKEAQDYVDSGFKTISKNHIQEMKDLGMTSTEYRKYRTGLSKAGTTNSEKLDYINNLNVSIEQKNIMANNIVDSEKYTVDMSNYNDYGSYDAMKYAMENPANYSIITSITKYDNYLSHKDEVNSIKEKYSGTEKSTVRKQKVFEYINSLPYNKAQKIILFKMLGNYSISDYQNDVFNYVNGLKISKSEKEQMWKQIYGK